MQFASDLDESTQKKIERWKRMVEMLKQPPHKPIPFYKQVVLIYAGINGYLDEIEVEQISKFENILYEKLDTVYKDLADKIKEVKDLIPEIEEWMKKVVAEVIKEVKSS